MMKKLSIAILTCAMLAAVGCSKPNTAAPDPEQIKEEVIGQISGDMDFQGVWTDPDDSDLQMIVTATGENEYDMTAYLSIDAHSAESWTMHGTYDPASGMLSYKDGDYAVRKMTADGNEVQEDETKVEGALMKTGDETCTWQDSKLSANRNLKLDSRMDNIPTIRLADGPYVMENVGKKVLTEEQKERFEKAVHGQVGVGFTPIQVLAEQIVSGMNYVYLAYGVYDLGNPKGTYTILKIYENLDGEVSLETENFLDVNDLKTAETETEKGLMGGWKIVDNEEDGILNHEVDDVFMKAANENYDGSVGALVTIALLGTAEENGSTFYRLLVRGTTEEINPEKDLYVFEVERTADGTCKVNSVSVLDLTAYLN